MGLIMGGKTAKVGVIEVEENAVISQGQVLLNIETGKGNKPVISEVNGKITKILINEGDEIKTGDILFEYLEKEIEDSEFIETIVEKNKKELKVDIVIIGGGPGGYVTAIYAAKKGKKVALIEKSKLGGTCLNYGCIPTKTFIESSNFYLKLKESSIFGIEANNFSFDINKIKERKEKICKENEEGIRFLLLSNQVTLIEGFGKILNNKEVQVEDNKNLYTIKTSTIIIATGSESFIPEWFHKDVCMDSKDVLENFQVPDSILIVGAGVIGMEFASVYSALGTKVEMLEFGETILTNIDDEVKQIIKTSLEKRKVVIKTSSEVLKIEKSTQGKAVIFYKNNGKEYISIADKVLVSIGRKPILDKINLDEIGIKYNKKGIITNEFFETNIEGIYAIGDVNGKIQLAHAAYSQGISVVNRILNNSEKSEELLIPNVIFTMPEIATVGITKNMKPAFEIEESKFPFSANGKAKIENETIGFVKIIINKESKEIIGATIVGPEASSLISILTLAIKKKLIVNDVEDLVFPHPTLSEAIWEASLGFKKGFIHYYE